MIRWASYETHFGTWRWLAIGRVLIGIGPGFEGQRGPTLIAHWLTY